MRRLWNGCRYLYESKYLIVNEGGLLIRLFFDFFLKALSNEANELLPIFNKTTSKFYRTVIQTGDWSNQATNLGDRQISTNIKKHQLPQSCEESMTGAI